MANASQAVTGTITFEGFGQTVVTTGSSTNPYKFAATSAYRDDGDAGLFHVGARHYDALVGRFITRDTVLSEHPYLYCAHEPVNHVDPSGHIPAWFKDIINFNKPVTGPAWGWGIGIGAVGTTAGNINYIMGPNPGPFGNGLGIITGLGGIGSGAGLITGGLELGGAAAVGAVGIGAIAVGFGAVAVGYGIYRLGSNFQWW